MARYIQRQIVNVRDLFSSADKRKSSATITREQKPNESNEKNAPKLYQNAAPPPPPVNRGAWQIDENWTAAPKDKKFQGRNNMGEHQRISQPGHQDTVRSAPETASGPKAPPRQKRKPKPPPPLDLEGKAHELGFTSDPTVEPYLMPTFPTSPTSPKSPISNAGSPSSISPPSARAPPPPPPAPPVPVAPQRVKTRSSSKSPSRSPEPLSVASPPKTNPLMSSEKHQQAEYTISWLGDNVSSYAFSRKVETRPQSRAESNVGTMRSSKSAPGGGRRYYRRGESRDEDDRLSPTPNTIQRPTDAPTNSREHVHKAYKMKRQAPAPPEEAIAVTNLRQVNKPRDSENSTTSPPQSSVRPVSSDGNVTFADHPRQRPPSPVYDVLKPMRIKRPKNYSSASSQHVTVLKLGDDGREGKDRASTIVQEGVNIVTDDPHNRGVDEKEATMNFAEDAHATLPAPPPVPAGPRRPRSVYQEYEGEDYGNYLKDDMPDVIPRPQERQKTRRRTRSAPREATSTISSRDGNKSLRSKFKPKSVRGRDGKESRKSIYEFSYGDSKIGYLDNSEDALRSSQPDLSQNGKNTKQKGTKGSWWRVETLSARKGPRTEEVYYKPQPLSYDPRAHYPAAGDSNTARGTASAPDSDAESDFESSRKKKLYTRKKKPEMTTAEKTRSMGRATLNRMKKLLGRSKEEDLRWNENIYEEIIEGSVNNPLNKSIPVPIPAKDYEGAPPPATKSKKYVMQTDDVAL